MVKIALMGAGRMGHRFSQAIRRGGHELALIFDPSENPWAVQQEPELTLLHTRDFDDVNRSDAEIYVICSTADFHVSTATDLIEAGKKRLIIEKPLCQSVSEGEALHALASKHCARIIVNHGRRYSTNTAALKRLNGDRKTGALRSILIKMGGGSFGCVGTHWIDLCNNLMNNKPEKVFATLSHETPPDNRGERFFDPGGTAVLVYPGGRRAIIDIGDDIGIVASTEFIYEKGIVSWITETGKWSFRHRRPEDLDKSLGNYGLPLIESPFETTPPDLLDYAISTINDALSEKPCNSGVPEALETMEVFAAIRYAARIDQVVHLPIPDDEKQVRYAIP